MKSESVAWRGIFVVSFVVILAIAVPVQLVTGKWRAWLPGAEGSKTLVGGVRSGVYTFMSYLT